jgi:hypothetical protein
MGAPPLGQLSDQIDGTRVSCTGKENTFPDFVIVTENFAGSPISGSPGLPLERTDSTIPWTSTGQHVTRNEYVDAEGTKSTTTDTWTWTLTLEPDGGQ